MHLTELIKDLTKKMGTLEKEIAREMVIELQRNTPVDTGHLRSSWFYLPAVNGQTTIVNTANYAVFVENGTDRQRAQKYTQYTIKYKTGIVLERAIKNIHTGTNSLLERMVGGR
jgi:hypothetical protein